MQVVGAMASVEVALGKAVSVKITGKVSVGSGVKLGKMSCEVGKAWVGGSGCCGTDSARASEIPPMTNTMETIAMSTPPPN